jgi:hypothetical protein
MEANTCVFTIPTASSAPPPATIPLRPAPPMSQPPAPVVRSEPAVPEAAFNTSAPAAGGAAGSHLRGDTKWPPTCVRVQREAEREQQAAIARGPAVRPRRNQKDYTSFFEQNRLQGTGTHYRPPPGTQHYPVA